MFYHLLEKDEKALGPVIAEVATEEVTVMEEVAALEENYDNIVTTFDYKPNWPGVKETSRESIQP